MQFEGRPAGPPSDQASGHEANRRLESWKEIADHFRRGVTTVQRWENDEGLPVHRHDHTKKGSVYAYTRELNEWRAKRGRRPDSSQDEGPASQQDPLPVPKGSRVRQAVLVGVATVVAAAALVVVAGVRTGRDRTLDPSPTQAEAGPNISPRPLASEPGVERNASLSPDGRHVVYHWRRPDSGSGLFIKDLQSADVRRLTAGPGVESLDTDDYPAWSPAGDAIAFLRGRHNQRRDVLLVSPFGGTSERKLADADGVSLSWTPDGRQIAFVDKPTAGEPFGVFLLSLDTGQRIRLTSPRLGSFGDTLCAVSPDGRHVAFARFDAPSAADIHVVPIGGGEPRQVTKDASPVGSVVWTPDGHGIVFSSYRKGGSRLRLWYVRAAGEEHPEPILVAGPEGGSMSATFARAAGHASRLVYTHTWTDVNIWRLTADKNSRPAPVANSTAYDSHPAISVDGTRLAFVSNRTGSGEIWVSGIDGSNARQLTSFGGAQVIWPRWSPDGSRLVFWVETADTGRGDVYVVNADGTGLRRFTTEESHESRPSWSADGRWIYFTSNRTGIDHVWRAPADGSDRPVDVTRSEAIEGHESQDGRLLYFIRGLHRPGIMSMPISGGEPVPVVPGVTPDSWTITKAGIVYLTLFKVPASEKPHLKLFDPKSETVRDLGELPALRGPIVGGFAASWDGRMHFWVQSDAELADLMLVDQWVPPTARPLR